MAAGDIKLAFGAWTEAPWTSNNQEGLANATLTTAWSNEVDLSAATVVDVQVFLLYNVQTALGTGPVISVLAVGDANGTYPPVASGHGALVGNVVPSAAAAAERSNIMSVAQAFGGSLPNKIKFGLLNNAGNALSATTDAVQVYYRTVYMRVVQA